MALKTAIPHSSSPARTKKNEDSGWFFTAWDECFKFFDTVNWETGRTSGPQKACPTLPEHMKEDKSSAVAEMGHCLATIDMSQKVGGLLCPFPWEGNWVPISNNVAWAEAYFSTKWHLDASNHLSTIHQRYRQTQRSCSTDTCNGRPKTKIELETAIKMEVTMVALIPTMCQLTATWSSNKLLSCCTTKKSYCLHDINAVTIHLDCTEYLHHYSHPALHRICKRSAVGTKQTTEDKNKLPTTGCRLSNYSSKTKWCILWLDQMLLSSSCKTETSNITVHITVASNFL